MADATVLLVDDEPALVRAVTAGLEARGYRVRSSLTGTAAIAAAASAEPDVTLLDLGLPDLDGVEVCRELRRHVSSPIIVLSADGAVDRKVAAFEEGADDYVTKPFGMDELLARMRAAERRSASEEAAPEVATAAFTVDLSAKRVLRDGEEVRVTPTEWHILELLAQHPGHLVSQRRLLQEVWGPAYRSETNYLRVYMAQLRRKLEPDPAHPRFLITEAGRGYRLETDG